MPRVSKRSNKADTRPKVKYYRTYVYLRLSEKDGGHGRRDSIYIQNRSAWTLQRNIRKCWL